MKNSSCSPLSSISLQKISKLYLVCLRSHISMYLQLLSRNNYIKSSAAQTSRILITRVIEQAQTNISCNKQQFINYISSQLKQQQNEKVLSPRINETEKNKKENIQNRQNKYDIVKNQNLELNKMLRMLMQKVITMQNKNIDLQKSLLKSNSKQYKSPIKDSKIQIKQKLISSYSKQYKQIKLQLSQFKNSVLKLRQQLYNLRKTVKLEFTLFVEECKLLILNTQKHYNQIISNLTIAKHQLKRKKDNLKYQLKLQKSLECLQWKSQNRKSSIRSLSEFKSDDCRNSKNRSIAMDIQKQIKEQQHKLMVGMKQIGARRRNFQIK